MHIQDPITMKLRLEFGLEVDCCILGIVDRKVLIDGPRPEAGSPQSGRFLQVQQTDLGYSRVPFPVLQNLHKTWKQIIHVAEKITTTDHFGKTMLYSVKLENKGFQFLRFFLKFTSFSQKNHENEYIENFVSVNTSTSRKLELLQLKFI